MKDWVECRRKLGVERGFSFVCIYREENCLCFEYFQINGVCDECGHH